MQLWLNWLWQGTAVTVLVACAVRARSMNAATRERIWSITLIVVALIPLLQLLPAFGEGSEPIAPTGPPPVLTVRLASPSTVGAIVAGLWALWTALSLARLATACVRLSQARKLAVPFDPDREARLANWTALGGTGRATRLAVSEHVHRAAVLGWTTPMIVLAPATLDTLTDDELDLVILHEYAHVKRRDDVALVVQRVITAFAGLHPAVWWLDRAVTIEREAACDDWVVGCTGALKPYASSLVRLTAAAGQHRCSLAPGAALSRTQLVTRLLRLLDPRRNRNPVRSRSAVWFARVGVTAAAAAAAAIPLVAVEVRRHASAEGRSILPATRAEVPRRSAIPTLGDTLASRAGVARARSRQPRQRAPAPLSPSAVTTPLRDATPAPRAVPQEPASFEETDRLAQVLAAYPLAGKLYEAPGAPARGSIEIDEPVWNQAAGTGAAVGRQSRAAAVAAASLFTRFGRSLVGAF